MHPGHLHDTPSPVIVLKAGYLQVPSVLCVFTCYHVKGDLEFLLLFSVARLTHCICS